MEPYKQLRTQAEILVDAANRDLDSLREGGAELHKRYLMLGGVFGENDHAYQTIRDRAVRALQEVVTDPTLTEKEF